MADTHHESVIEEFEERIEANQEKAEMYDGEKASWFKGIATGYRGALENLRRGDDGE